MTNHRRRARNAIIAGLAGFIALQAGLAMALAIWIPRFREGDYGVKAARLEGRMHEPGERPFTVVMLGSSRTAFGLHGQSGEQRLSELVGRRVVFFNFGLWGAGPVTELLNTRRLLADGLRPDLLLVEVMPAMLAGQAPLTEVDAKILPAASLRGDELSLIRRYAKDRRPELKREWRLSWIAPWYCERFALLSRIFPSLISYKDRVNGFVNADRSGWMAPTNPPRTEAERAEKRSNAQQEYAARLATFQLGGPGVDALRELLTLCRRERLPVMLVVMPEGPTFRSWYSPGSWEQVAAFLHGVGGEFQVPVVNAREWIAEELFLDSHHLLPEGAELFTRRLAEDSIRPLLRSGNSQPVTQTITARTMP